MNVVQFTKSEVVPCVVTAEGKTLIASWSKEGEIFIHTKSGERRSNWQMQDPIVALAFSPDELLVLMQDADGWLRVMPLVEGGRNHSPVFDTRFTTHNEGVTGIAVSQDQSLLALSIGSEIKIFAVRVNALPKFVQKIECDSEVVSISFYDGIRSIMVTTKESVSFFLND